VCGGEVVGVKLDAPFVWLLFRCPRRISGNVRGNRTLEEARKRVARA